MKTAIVTGAGGFIGNHLVNALRDKNYYVIGVDIKQPEFHASSANEFIIADLREQSTAREVIGIADELYQLAADMGGAAYVFSEQHDADIIHNSALINLNIVEQVQKKKISKLFFSSSACVYPKSNQLDPLNPNCAEHTAYPADPDSEYGWEKLFSERLYLSYAKNYGTDVRIARYHNIFGPLGTWQGGKEKAPAAICRKVAEANNGDSIEIWGTGTQTRSFLYIDECVLATLKLMNSDFTEPVNIGSEEMVSINQLAQMVIDISGKNITVSNIPGPAGVAGRNSNNDLARQHLNWDCSTTLKAGLEKTYQWVESQVNENRRRKQ